MTLAPSPSDLHSCQTINHLPSSSPFSSPRATLSRIGYSSASSPSINDTTQKIFSEMLRECLDVSPRGKSPTSQMLCSNFKRLTPIRVYDLSDSPVLNLLISQLPSPKAPSGQEVPLFATIFSEPILQIIQNELVETNGNLNEFSEEALSSITSFAKFINEFDLSDIFKNESETQYVVDCLTRLTDFFSEVISLSMKDHSHLGSDVMEKIAGWEKLEVLNLTNSVKLFAQSPNLLNFHFEYLTELYLGQNLEFLQSVTSQEDKIFTVNDQNLHFITKKFALSRLDITGATITPAASFKLGNLTQLTYLNLSNCLNLKSDSFGFVSNLGLLEEIDISGIELNQEALFNIGRAKKIKKITLSLEAISKSNSDHPGFSLQLLMSRFLSAYPHIHLSVPAQESENLKRILDEHRVHISRTSRFPKGDSISLPDLF
jgi:hypothetical protein